MNIDRYGHECYGYSASRKDIAYEISNNSDPFDLSGSADDIKTRTSTNFKYRYHYSDEGLVTDKVTSSNALNMASGLHDDLLQLVQWTGASDGTEFKSNFKNHWALDNMIDYHLLTLAFGMVDSYTKNMVIASYGTSTDADGNTTRIFYPLMYDGDTALGLNNQGQLIETPGCDTIWNGVEIGNYDGYHSQLWEKLNRNFAEEIKERYSELRRTGWFTVDKMMSYIYTDVIAKVGQKFYNEDMKYKYQENNEKLDKRDFCRGTREEFTRRWLYERLSYLDSRFQVGDEALTTAVVRSNVVDVVTLTIETYHPQWVSVTFIDNKTPVVKRLAANTPTTFSSSECPDIPGGLITNPVNNNITIQCVSNIKKIDGIVDLRPSEISIGYMKRLISLDAHGSNKLYKLEILNNENLQTLNVKDCPQLGYDPNAHKYNGSLDLTGCPNLRTVDISNTGLSGCELPENSGSLEYFDGSKTNIGQISMVGQPYIEEIKMNQCLLLGKVIAKNCSRLKNLILANTSISTLDITLCPNIDLINISGTSNLNALSLNACQNLRVLNMEGFKSPNYNILNLSTCPNIAELYLSGTTNLVGITFHENGTKLKKLDISNSSIKAARFGQNVEMPNYLDLGHFNLTSFNCSNNNQIQYIKNINYDGSGNRTFFQCNNLVSIECKQGGKLKLTGELKQTFYYCQNLTGIPSQLDLSASTSSTEAFAWCQKLTLAQAKMIMDSTKNTGLNSGEHWRFFRGCTKFNNGRYVSGITGELSANFFENAKSLSGMYEMFMDCDIKGQIPGTLLQPMKNKLTSTQYAFANITGITGDLPSNLFHNLTKLVNINNMFDGCTNLGGSLSQGMFKDLTSLQNAWTVFGNCKNLIGKIPDDLFANCTNLADCSGMFTGCTGLFGQIPDTIFSNPNGKKYTKLVKISSMFSGCSGLEGEFPANLLLNVPNVVDVSSLFNGCSKIESPIPNYFFQNTSFIQNASYCFANTGANGAFPNDIFKGLSGLTNVSGFFNGCKNIHGNLPLGLFSDNPQLKNIDYLFSGMTGITGDIPENLFFGLEPDPEDGSTGFGITSAKGVFRNCSQLSGFLPEKLLYKFGQVEDLSEFFYHCYYLRGDIPSGIGRTDGYVGFLGKCTKLKRCNHMFNEANGIGNRNPNSNNPYAIPEDLFEHNLLLEECYYMFQSWGHSTPLPSNVSHGLSGAIPPNLFDNNRKLLNVSYMFAGQSGLVTRVGQTDIPISGDLFRYNTNIENVAGLFGGCGGLGLLGDGFLGNNKKLINVTELFRGCSNLVGTAVPLWQNTYAPLITGTDSTKFAMAYMDCKKLTNYYTEIPTQWGGGYNPTA